jgi:putative DNA primase/helicase
LIRAEAKKQKTTADYEHRLRELEATKPKAPRVPKLLRGDDTPENLGLSLAKEWPSAGVLSSEAGLILGAHGMGRESIMRNLALLNILWDGKTHDTGRKTSESFTLRGVRFTVGLQVQEATLRIFFEDSKGLARGMGFFARFLVAWPESTQGYRPFSEPPKGWPKLEAFHRRVSELLNMPVPIDDNGVLTPIVLSFTPEAKGAWIAYHDAIESELRTGGELYDVRDVASKSADNAARLAAHFQVFQHGPGAIGLDAFQRAARIAAWHLNESRRFFGLLALPIEVSNAARLDAWLIDYCRRERVQKLPVSRIQTYGPNAIRSKAAIEAATGELRELYRAKLVESGHARVVAVNPALLVPTTATTARTATAEQYAGGIA